jgi:GT2 family glycosyltransferase
VIVPTRDRAELLARCVEGVLSHTDYPALELIIADNDSIEPRTHELFDGLAKDPRVRVIPAPGPFNYSDINNRMVAQARGEVLLFLNNDVVVTEPGWLKAMVAQAVRPQVGAVGARLTFPDGRVQHGGVILGAGLEPHVAGNLYVGAPGDDPGYFHHLKLARNLSAVTAACLAMRRAVFDEIGGFDAEHLAVAFNDVDLCLKAGERGYQVIWTPLAELTHVESASRGSDLAPERQAQFLAEGQWMRTRWGELLDNDPFHGPNFDHRRGDYRLADPPRRVPPWRRA